MSEYIPIKNCSYKPSVSRADCEDIEELLEMRKSLNCPEQWQKLEPTDDNKVRFCDKCERKVHLVVNDEELGRAIRMDQCIAWEVPEDVRKKYDTLKFTLGRPELGYGPVTRKMMFKCSNSDPSYYHPVGPSACLVDCMVLCIAAI
jgi:hypothetical protein